MAGPACTAALSTGGSGATSMFDEPTNGERVRTSVTDTPIPTLDPGDTVILDNLGAHTVADVRAAIQGAGARLLDLPPCCPTPTRSEAAPADAAL